MDRRSFLRLPLAGGLVAAGVSVPAIAKALEKRKFKVTISRELIEDMRGMHGLDAEKEMRGIIACLHPDSYELHISE